jgi:O-antigen/teichoic acid export membrane protein
MHKQTGISTMIWTGSAGMNVLLNIILIPWLGILGAGISTLLVYIGALGITWKLVKKRVNIPLNISVIAKSIAASFVMGMVVVLMEPHGLLEVIIASILGGGVYFFMLLLLGGVTSKERDFFLSLLQNFRNALSHP